MFKNNYKTWGISIGLHVVIIYSVSRQTVEVQQPEKVTVMQAYVMVDLAAVPDINSSTQPAFAATAFESEAKLSEVEQSTEQPEAKLRKHDAKSHVDEPAIISKTSPQTKPSSNSAKVEPPSVQVAADKHKVGVDQQGAEQPFKKLNPYAPIPLITPPNEVRNSFDYPHSAIPQSADDKLRLTVPKEHTSSFQSDVVWQSADGSQRMEMYKGMCYKIDFNGVMGKVGLPQGSPRPCKDNDGILFDKIMDKWNSKKPLK
ncbi:hypothetical protein CWC11_01330 [Pseudoalteromonas sp. S3178]|uniref:hypothetical protein n=1 Tax=Pseudoalteromonas sp. S3178 TaxID=579532 RepID=UPI00110A3788|nr:hypothetical protein [Pseudoalteromonas sp. S3178]TMP11713.1 hypothetical protein CWC11_01330 [Pseudoalteromonas sp. S3178]